MSEDKLEFTRKEGWHWIKGDPYLTWDALEKELKFNRREFKTFMDGNKEKIRISVDVNYYNGKTFVMYNLDDVRECLKNQVIGSE